MAFAKSKSIKILGRFGSLPQGCPQDAAYLRCQYRSITLSPTCLVLPIQSSWILQHHFPLFTMTSPASPAFTSHNAHMPGLQHIPPPLRCPWSARDQSLCVLARAERPPPVRMSLRPRCPWGTPKAPPFWRWRNSIGSDDVPHGVPEILMDSRNMKKMGFLWISSLLSFGKPELDDSRQPYNWKLPSFPSLSWIQSAVWS